MSKTKIHDLPSMLEISKITGIGSGTVHRIITKFCEDLAYNVYLRGYSEVDLESSAGVVGGKLAREKL